MKNRKRLFMVGLLLMVVVSMAILWAVVRPRDPIFRGKPESQWIEQLAYRDEEQIKQWREFSSDGVRVLVRGLEGSKRPADRFYRNTYRRMSGILPCGVMRILPAPPNGCDPQHAVESCQSPLQFGQERAGSGASDGPSP